MGVFSRARCTRSDRFGYPARNLVMLRSLSIRSLVLCGLGFSFGFAAACDDDDDCQRGTERCACLDGACLEGLVCLSGHCVDPHSGGSGASGGSADDAGEGEGGTPSHDNVAACKALVNGIACGDSDISSMVDCDAYANHVCDITDYFDCLRDGTVCNDGILDTSGWIQCVSLAECG